MRSISLFFLVSMFFLSSCAMFLAPTQMLVQSEAELAKIKNPTTVKIERNKSNIGGSLPFVIYDGGKKVGQLGPSGAFEWKRKAGYLKLTVEGGRSVIPGDGFYVFKDPIHEDYLRAGDTYVFKTGLKDGVITIEQQQEKAPEDIISFGRVLASRTIISYNEPMKPHVDSSRIDGLIRQCDYEFEESVLNIDNLKIQTIDITKLYLNAFPEMPDIYNQGNLNINVIKAYLKVFPKGKYAQYSKEVIQYYEAETRPSKKAFENYLTKWPNGHFEKWAKDNYAFDYVGVVQDQSVFEIQTIAGTIVEHGLAEMSGRIPIKKYIYSEFAIYRFDLNILQRSLSSIYKPFVGIYANNDLPKGTLVEFLPEQNFSLTIFKKWSLMKLKALASIDSTVAQFNGVLLYIDYPGKPYLHYISRISGDGIKDGFILLKFGGSIDPNADISNFNLNDLSAGSSIILDKKIYYYDGSYWTHAPINSFFHTIRDDAMLSPNSIRAE